MLAGVLRNLQKNKTNGAEFSFFLYSLQETEMGGKVWKIRSRGRREGKKYIGEGGWGGG